MSQPAVDTKPLFRSSLRAWQEAFRARRQTESTSETQPEAAPVRQKRLIPRRKQKERFASNKK